MNMGKSVIDFNEKKGFICDMDGVIYHGNQILPGVPEFIQWLHDEKKEYLFLTTVSPLTVKARTKKKHGSLWKAILLRKDRKRLLPIGISQYCKMCWINSLVIAESRNIIRHRMEKERNFLF